MISLEQPFLNPANAIQYLPYVADGWVVVYALYLRTCVFLKESRYDLYRSTHPITQRKFERVACIKKRQGSQRGEGKGTRLISDITA